MSRNNMVSQQILKSHKQELNMLKAVFLTKEAEKYQQRVNFI